MLRSLPFQIFLMVVLAVFIAPFLSTMSVQVFYTISCVLKDLLMIALPLIIFSFIFSSMLKLSTNAPILILTVLSTTIISNVLAFSVPFYMAQLFMSCFNCSSDLSIETAQKIIPLFALPIPDFWSPKIGMIGGLVLGIALSFLKNSSILKWSEMLKGILVNLLNRYFIPILPLFIFGFFLKLQYEGSIAILFKGFGKILCMTMVIFIGYLGSLSLLVNRFDLKKVWEQIRSSFNTFVTGFSTMSSIATMPLVLRDSARYVPNKEYPQFIIPFILNMHMIGSSAIFGIMIVVVLSLFQMPMPSFTTFMALIYYYVLARFSVAGVPGGSTMIMGGLVKSQLHFTDDMVAVFITLDLLHDGFMTVGNAFGNILYTQWSYGVFGKRVFK